MSKTLARLLTPLALLAGIVFVILVVNQTAQIVALAEAAHPAAGRVVFWTLLVIYAACVVTPLVLFFRLPRPLAVPEQAEGPEFERHLAELGRRLSRGAGRAGAALSRADIELRIKTLDQEADALIRRTGSQVFVTTAISQNGSLDALVVLVVQTRMIWQIAHVYDQRPTLRGFVRLYANVAATAFVAGELDDLDLADQIHPVVSGTLGSTAAALPGLGTASALFVNSVFSGATNAFLTLRVGLIAKQYCGALVRRPKSQLRRAATLQAGSMLGGIVLHGARRISTAFIRSSGRQVVGAVGEISSRVRGAGRAVAAALRRPREDDPPS